MLDAHAPLSPVSLCPGILAFSAQSLVVIWQAAERVAGEILPSPFWAFPWPGGIAIARILLDGPSLVRGRSVIDVGAGGGVACFAAARAGAARVVACDIDPWALAVTRLAAERQGLAVETLEVDITSDGAVLDDFDVVLCGDLGYDRSAAADERAAIERAVARGALALIGDAGRTYFDDGEMELVSSYSIDVVADLEGAETKIARAYRMG
jgi:predicted nicotinamide N-methyase